MALTPQIEERRGYDGPAVLERGFRPFFFLAGLWALISVGVWLGFLTGKLTGDAGLDLLRWHAHELIFGYGGSVVMGFALTAIPNWTGRLPVRGKRLLGLALFWLLARLTSLASLWNADLYPLAAGLESAVFAAFALLVLAEIMTGKNWRNLPIAIMITLLGLTAGVSHLGRLELWDVGAIGTRAGLAMLLILMTLIGGRIIPSFTRNWLKSQNEGVDEARLPAPFGPLDKAVIAGTILSLVLWLAWPDAPAVGGLMIAVGLLHMIRLGRWRGASTLAEPLVTVLHLGYFWIGAGFLLVGLAALGLYPAPAALHAWTIGAVGGMTMAVMTRASLGHSGRPVTASGMTIAAFALLHTAALSRVLDGMVSVEGLNLVTIAGLCWIAAYALYVFEYAPVQLRR